MTQERSGVRADRGYSYKKIERIAAFVREKLEVSPTVAIETLRLFDGLDISVNTRTGQGIPIRGGVIDLEDLEGFTKYDKHRRVIEILASSETYSWLEQDHPRGGFFVAHELGHGLLHTDQLMRLARMPAAQQTAFHRGGEGSTHEVFRDTEWQANAFASAFLMPARGLLALDQKYTGLSPLSIAECFHVSVQAASYRLNLYNDRKQQLL